MDQEQMVSAVLQAVQALPQDRQPLIVALDGRCASGKTTLAALLQQQTGCSVVHMDHFFLPARAAHPRAAGAAGRQRRL